MQLQHLRKSVAEGGQGTRLCPAPRPPPPEGFDFSRLYKTRWIPGLLQRSSGKKNYMLSSGAFESLAPNLFLSCLPINERVF